MYSIYLRGKTKVASAVSLEKGLDVLRAKARSRNGVPYVLKGDGVAIAAAVMMRGKFSMVYSSYYHELVSTKGE